MFNKELLTKIRNDPGEFKSQWGIAKNNDERTEILNELKSGCSPEVAKLIISNTEYSIEAKMIPQDEFGNLYTYLLREWLKELPYEKAIPQLLKFYQDRPNLALKIIINFLHTDPNFKENFCKDDKYVPQFGKNLIRSLSDTNDPDLMSISETIQKLKLNEEFAFSTMKKIFKFDEPLTSQQKDIIKIALFLNDTDAVKSQLSKLEEILEERAASRWDPNKKSLIDYQTNKPLDHKKFFSNYLYEWAKENNFPNYAKIYKKIDPNAFLDALKLSSLIIDKAFRGIQHGEWIHIIQVWCFSEYDKEMKKNNQTFISNSPPDIIKWIGHQESSVWDNTFDEVNSYDYWPKSGWRNPFEGSNFFASRECADKFPILHQLIVGRALKPKKSYDEKPGSEIWDTSTLNIKK